MRSKISCTVIFLFIFLSFSTINYAKTYSLQNDHIALHFSTDEGICLEEIKRVGDSTSLVHNTNKQPLWRTLWINDNKEQFHLDSTEPCQFNTRYESSENSMRLYLEWSRLPLGKGNATLRVTVELKPESMLSEWHMNIDWTDSTIIPLRVEFPIINGVADNSKNNYLAIPYYWGRLVRDPLNRLKRYRITYPSPASMQFISYHRIDQGIFLSAYDPEIWMKSWVWNVDKVSRKGSMYIESYPPYDTNYHYEVPYPIMVGIVSGSWYDAALLYRQWATTQKWCQGGAISNRTDIPNWFKEVAIWLKYYAEPGKVLFELFDHFSYLNVPTSLLYYHYPESSFDDNYPEFLPARTGFLESIQDIHRLGSHIIPYTNGSIWDTDTRTWNEYQGEGGAVISSTGQPLLWDIRGTIFAYMCPSSQVWQNKIIDFTQKLVLDYASDGVYLDLMAATQAKTCWSPFHNHTQNGGRYWGEGTRSLMENLQDNIRAYKPEAVFTTEEINEAYIDKFDGFLTLDITRGINKELYSFIPLFSAVYHDYTIQFGSDAKLSAEPEQFYSIIAYHFILGSKLTLSELNPPRIGVELEKAGYLKELVTCYYEVGREFLLEGQMLRPPDIKVDSLKISFKWRGGDEVIIPAVLLSLWRSADSSLGLAMTNWTGEGRDISFDLDLREYGPDAKSLFLHTLWPKNRNRATELHNQVWRFRDRITPRSVRFYKITPNATIEIEEMKYPDLPFEVIRRKQDGRFTLPSVGKGQTWSMGGNEVSFDEKGEILINGIHSKRDFHLLEKVQTDTTPQHSYDMNNQPDSIALRSLSSLSLRLSDTYHRLNRDQAAQYQIASVESLRSEIMDDIFNLTGLKLSIIPPYHYRLIPGVPSRISCQLLSPIKDIAQLKQLQIYPISQVPIIQAVHIEPENGNRLRQQNIVKEERYHFNLVVTDFNAVEHAITFYAEAEIYWLGELFILMDLKTVPCDLPLLTAFSPEVEWNWTASSTTQVELKVKNISDYLLSVSTKPVIPDGWSSKPEEISDYLVQPSNLDGSERKIKFMITPPANVSQGIYPLYFHTSYNSLLEFEVVNKLDAAVTPLLIPLREGNWHPDSSKGDDVFIRRSGRILLYLNAGESAKITIANSRVGSFKNPCVISITNPHEKHLHLEEIPIDQSRLFNITADLPGTYVIEVKPGQSSCTVYTDHQYMVFEASTNRPLNIFKIPKTWFFFVPRDARSFSIEVVYGGETEPADFFVFYPDGTEALERKREVGLNERVVIDVPDQYSGKAWSMKIIPKEDVTLKFSGDILPYLADHPLRLLRQKSAL